MEIFGCQISFRTALAVQQGFEMLLRFLGKSHLWEGCEAFELVRSPWHQVLAISQAHQQRLGCLSRSCAWPGSSLQDLPFDDATVAAAEPVRDRWCESLWIGAGRRALVASA
ncbi:unnamed protein product [Prunus armeniaca]